MVTSTASKLEEPSQIYIQQIIRPIACIILASVLFVKPWGTNLNSVYQTFIWKHSKYLLNAHVTNFIKYNERSVGGYIRYWISQPNFFQKCSFPDSFLWFPFLMSKTGLPSRFGPCIFVNFQILQPGVLSKLNLSTLVSVCLSDAGTQ